MRCNGETFDGGNAEEKIWKPTRHPELEKTMTTPMSKLDLSQFTGTSQWYPTIVPSITYTDGAKYVADTAGAYWLLDDIALYNTYEKTVQKEEFQVWKLAVNLEEKTGVLTCSDGGKNGHKSKVVFTKQIPFTDFPVSELVIWFTDNVILLPSEY